MATKKIIAIPIKKYSGTDSTVLHFSSIEECSKKWKFPITRIYEAIREGKPIKGYFLDEEIEQ